ncbi:MAG TPA: hypothetical protein VHY09_14135 [Candidatus Methylacidiphilales bacterium]|jgi:hypothetical protein|nr:hypothetical protein [Candidatus Methylacidiphilales bacterium]
MNHNDPETIWKNLLAQSATTFEPELAPPYGFVTSILAGLRAEQRQERECERIGLRALWVSLAALGVAATVTVTVSLHQDNSDLDPGVRSLVQVENLPYS